MRNREPVGLTDEPRYSVSVEPLMKPVEEISEHEWAALRSYERIEPRQKPARPDAIDIARTWAVIIAGGLVGVMIVVIVFMLLQP